MSSRTICPNEADSYGREQYLLFRIARKRGLSCLTGRKANSRIESGLGAITSGLSLDGARTRAAADCLLLTCRIEVGGVAQAVRATVS